MRRAVAMLGLLTLAGCRLLDSKYDGSMSLKIGRDGFIVFTAEPWDEGSAVHSLDDIGDAIESGDMVRVVGEGLVELDVHRIRAVLDWWTLSICADEGTGEVIETGGAAVRRANDACLIVSPSQNHGSSDEVAVFRFHRRQVWATALLPWPTGVIVPIVAGAWGIAAMAWQRPRWLRRGRVVVIIGIVSGVVTVGLMTRFAATVPDLPAGTSLQLTTARSHEAAGDTTVAVVLSLIVLAGVQAWVARERRSMPWNVGPTRPLRVRTRSNRRRPDD